VNVANARLIASNQKPVFGAKGWIAVRDLLRLACEVQEYRLLWWWRDTYDRMSVEHLNRAALERELQMWRRLEGVGR
jgi:hypothetical protein